MTQYGLFIKPVAFLLLFLFSFQATVAAAMDTGETQETKPVTRNALLKQQHTAGTELTGVLALDKILLAKNSPAPPAVTPGSGADDEGFILLSMGAGVAGLLLFALAWGIQGSFTGAASSFLGILGLAGMGLTGLGCCIFSMAE